MSTYKVIDVSKYNIVTDYAQASKAVNGVIIRSGYRSYSSGTLTEDPSFKTHIENFSKNNLPVGIYFFTTAINPEEAKQEAEFAVNLIKKYKLSFPIFVDTEMSNNNHNGRSDKLSKVVRTNCIVAFCERVKQLGYVPGVYASDSWFVSQLDFDKVKNYKLWVASYSKAPVRVTNYVGWQFSSTQTVVGIKGNVDMSNWYVDIKKPTTIGNPYTKPTTTLKKGSKGDGVRWLQYELNNHGYNLKIDGDFGNLTFNAVKDFQQKTFVDGIAGPDTIAALAKKVVSGQAPVSVGSGLEMIDGSESPYDSEFDKDSVFHVDSIRVYRRSILPIASFQLTGDCTIVDSAIKHGKVKITTVDGSVTGWVKIEDIIM